MSRIYLHAKTALFIDYLLISQAARALWDLMPVDDRYPLSR